MFSLDGKVAWVTGASRGIGRAICVSLARAGAYVVVNYPGSSEEPAASETLRMVQDAGGRGEPQLFDVSDPEQVERAFAEGSGRLGRLDVLVNNAGIARDQLLLRVGGEDLERTWAVNVNGAIYCAKAAIRPMIRARRGRIINLSSVVAESGNPGQVAYSASKAAVIGLTKTLAREYASRGVTVNAVAPGFIDTDMTAGLPEDYRTRLVEQTPAGRMGNPQEVAAAVLYLSSEEAAFVTGQVIRVNGGMYM
ncbi:MAG: 3-oxoacyl-ACP reductase FabG [Proteobacteria bacterium]|nr:3-oxoacyl-ACP reductase FabG [Pseudomonadota bacterium]